MCNSGYFLSFVDGLGTRTKMHKLLQVCSQVVNKLSSHCLFLICCNKVGTSYYVFQVIITRLEQVIIYYYIFQATNEVCFSPVRL